MKCQKCGSEWKNTNQLMEITMCPFCGKSLSEREDSNKPLTAGYVIKKIIEQFGVDIILNKKKFLSIFSDFAPNMKMEKKILSVALEENIGQIIVGTNPNEVEASIQKIKRALDIIMSENAINMIISSFSEALSWETVSVNYNLTANVIKQKNITNTDVYNTVQNSCQIASQVQIITRDEFIEKLKLCFVPLYSDLYLLYVVCISDDPMIVSMEWYEKALCNAKNKYAMNLSSDEHVFLFKQGDKNRIKLTLLKSKFKIEQELKCGFILTDKNIYIDDPVTSLEISISNIVSFDTIYQPESKQYILSLVYQIGSFYGKRCLIRSDSKICKLKNSLGVFLEKYKKCVNKIKP